VIESPQLPHTRAFKERFNHRPWVADKKRKLDSYICSEFFNNQNKLFKYFK